MWCGELGWFFGVVDVAWWVGGGGGTPLYIKLALYMQGPLYTTWRHGRHLLLRIPFSRARGVSSPQLIYFPPGCIKKCFICTSALDLAYLYFCAGVSGSKHIRGYVEARCMVYVKMYVPPLERELC